MKRILHLFGLLIFATCLALPPPALAQQFYPIDTTWFKNPERGFYVFANSHRVPSDTTGKGYWRLIANMPDSMSLVFEEFVLHDFKTSNISQDYLDMMQREFNNLRKWGMKAVVRFCYVTSYDWNQVDPPDTVGADISWMVKHVAQIQPVIRSNIDVIANFQAGFIGRWGEWGGGSGSEGFAYPDYSLDTAAQATLIGSLLSMLPECRMIDVRTPRYKFWYLHDLVPLTLVDWFSGAAKGRIGQHNDSFHGNSTNSGTFYDYSVHDTSFFRPWYKAETKFGGTVTERDGLWDDNYDPSWFENLEGWYHSFVQPMGRENAEMANQHVMAMGLDQDWSAEMQSRGLWNSLARRMGYRFQLISSVLPQTASPGGPYRLRIKVTNLGWSSPRNPRGLELVLRRDSSSAETVINLFRHKDPRLDPRLWWSGDTVQVDTTVVLPGNMIPGTYSAFVNLPDTCASIKGRPEYSVRLANSGVWEPLTGYNNLGAKVVVSGELKLDVGLAAGWNLLSLPLRVADSSVAAVYPGATDPAFAFTGGYVASSALTPGRGYWVKINQTKTVTVTGSQVSPRDISVASGWNIIGPFEQAVDISAITSTPSGIVSSTYNGYSGGYAVATTLSPGEGYWVKASKSGTLHLSGGVPKRDAVSATAPNWTQVELRDALGMKGTLCLAKAEEMKGSYEMPPLPPAGAFDVRFDGGTYVEATDKASHVIQLAGAEYPVTVKAINLNGNALSLKGAMDGTALDVPLVEGKPVTLTQRMDRLILVEVAQAGRIPTEFSLSQNYPNPFNPVTVIAYGLPKKSHTTITVFTTLGQQVAQLVNGDIEAGYHEVRFDGRGLASGVYFYRLQARSLSPAAGGASDFVQIRKSILMR